ncbi:RNA-binding protein 41-like [Ischnura elegans]|uniref:RNA-binding protein 41-like n=1 Tax=Ischnura elegans TaxID=197161 RepID=UPI001ED89082|nr:RNA-binding protein 41-like [Ischnura elegans]
MAQVHFSRGKAYELAVNGDENPTEYLESDGERLIKEMVQKQLNKEVSLKEQLEESKVFETAAEFIPLTKLTSGQISFTEFRELAEKASQIEDLKSKGLTEKEIEVLIDYEKGQSYFEEKYRKIEASALKTNLQEIRKKIETKSNERESEKRVGGERGVSRHELELSLSVKPQSDHTKLLQFALSCQPSAQVSSRPLNHPINNLKELENELFGHLKPSSGESKKKVPKRRLENLSEIYSNTVEFPQSASLWDKRTNVQPPKTFKSQSNKTEKKYECAPKKMFTIKDKKIVPLEAKTEEIVEGSASSSCSSTEGQMFVLTGKNEGLLSPIKLIPLEEISKHKMKDEDMAGHPHFKNYSQGEPSQTLYVKNISPTVKEEDLISLFGNFETAGENRIVYRLMTGRMRGQAFITFPNAEKASMALEAVNGYFYKGKPMVVQFGKSKK